MNSLEKLIVRDVRGGEVAPQLRRVAPPAPPAPLNVAAPHRAHRLTTQVTPTL